MIFQFLNLIDNEIAGTFRHNLAHALGVNKASMIHRPGWGKVFVAMKCDTCGQCSVGEIFDAKEPKAS